MILANKVSLAFVGDEWKLISQDERRSSFCEFMWLRSEGASCNSLCVLVLGREVTDPRFWVSGQLLSGCMVRSHWRRHPWLCPLCPVFSVSRNFLGQRNLLGFHGHWLPCDWGQNLATLCYRCDGLGPIPAPVVAELSLSTCQGIPCLVGWSREGKGEKRSRWQSLKAGPCWIALVKIRCFLSESWPLNKGRKW